MSIGFLFADDLASHGGGDATAVPIIARVRGFDSDRACFLGEGSLVADALVYADQAVDPNGDVMSFKDRLADMLLRHGSDSPNAAAHPQRGPLLYSAVRRVEQRRAGRRQSSSPA